ncbi:MAG: peptidoglycan DD-metalloendopeptidase family protein [Deltaproteobacteria bacterium]|nr:peptidoglycan DD-metalloendopeptidase family protein [Deltaproteobacteria bacterium]
METSQAVNTCLSANKAFRQRIRSFSYSFVFSLMLLGLFPVQGANARDWKAEKQSIEHKIESQSITINQLQQGLKLQQEQALETIVQERDLLAELEVIDIHLQEKLAKLHTLEDSIARQQELISTKEREISDIQIDKQKGQTHLQKRIMAYYKTGRIGIINVAFSAETLPKLLSIHDSFNTLIQYDQNILQQYRQTLEGLEQTKKALTLEKTLLDTFMKQTSQEKEDIEQTRQEKNELLAQIRTQTKLHEQAAQEIKKAANDLSAQIATMKQKRELLSQGFLLSKGKLSAPVSGRILSRYGQPKKNRMGVESISTGITMEAPDGTKVKAIFDGTIHYAGYLRGYGNTIIIDHGFQYYSVISRAETLLKKEGDAVMTGEDIAVMGETATLVEEGLYFEIRHDTETLDPLLWLDKNKLSSH